MAFGPGTSGDARPDAARLMRRGIVMDEVIKAKRQPVGSAGRSVDSVRLPDLFARLRDRSFGAA